MKGKTLITLFSLLAMVLFISGVAAAQKLWHASGTVLTYVADDQGRGKNLMLDVGNLDKYRMFVPKGRVEAQLLILVPKDAKITGEVSEGSKVNVTFKDVGDKDNHVLVATAVAVKANKA